MKRSLLSEWVLTTFVVLMLGSMVALFGCNMIERIAL